MWKTQNMKVFDVPSPGGTNTETIKQQRVTGEGNQEPGLEMNQLGL
jgi:hypothetical protein